jgi:hypothetical protein
MATALLVTTDDLKNNTIIDGNVDTAKFIQFMRIAQEVHIQNYLGTSLYRAIQAKIIAGTLTGDYLDLVNNYLKDMVIYFAMVDYVPFAAFQISNGGVFKHRSENSDTATKEEIDSLTEKYRQFAQFFTRRFLDYICDNSNLFPEYNSSTQSDMYPSTDADFTGWVL